MNLCQRFRKTPRRAAETEEVTVPLLPEEPIPQGFGEVVTNYIMVPTKALDPIDRDVVDIEVLVDQGTIEEARIYSSSGNQRFAENALQTVLRWQFVERERRYLVRIRFIYEWVTLSDGFSRPHLHEPELIHFEYLDL